jgi:DDE family transposase
MKHLKRSQYKHAKSRYRVRNWSEYEAGRQKRGDLTVWLSDTALEAALTIRMVFHLPLRQTEGFLRSLAQLLEVDLPIPDLTSQRTHDATRVPALLGQLADAVASVSADGAYDTRSVYEAVHEHSEGRAARDLIPPGRNARLSARPATALKERNRTVRSIRALGRRAWHRRSGYSRRSLVENAVYRYKTIIGQCMRSRSLEGQRVEVEVASKILNTMTSLGMPDSYRVA